MEAHSTTNKTNWNYAPPTGGNGKVITSVITRTKKKILKALPKSNDEETSDKSRWGTFHETPMSCNFITCKSPERQGKTKELSYSAD